LLAYRSDTAGWPVGRLELLRGGGCLGRSTFRILVVDDYEPWRSFASRTLQKKPELQVISEASDGLEAVQKTQELQPDLIVLDIGLPTVNELKRLDESCSVLRRQKSFS
jgi:CheY-like chemotaxis protein